MVWRALFRIRKRGFRENTLEKRFTPNTLQLDGGLQKRERRIIRRAAMGDRRRRRKGVRHWVGRGRLGLFALKCRAMHDGAAGLRVAPSAVALHGPMWDSLVQRGSRVTPQQTAQQLLMPPHAHWRCKKRVSRVKFFRQSSII
jgi:hypothetical protein